MPRFQTEKLIESLKADVQVLLQCADFFKAQYAPALLEQPAPEKWSVAQVLEHLNRYGQYYLPAIDKATAAAANTKSAWYTSGRLGDYFTNYMKPKSSYEIKSKMKTFKAYDPKSNLNADAVLNEFVAQQKKLLQLLELSKQRDLEAIRIPISISKMVKFRLGDTFRFFVVHEQRHMIQARNALHTNGIPTDKFPVVLQEALQ